MFGGYNLVLYICNIIIHKHLFTSKTNKVMNIAIQIIEERILAFKNTGVFLQRTLKTSAQEGREDEVAFYEKELEILDRLVCEMTSIKTKIATEEIRSEVK